MFFGLVPLFSLFVALFFRRFFDKDDLVKRSLYSLGVLVLVTLNLGGFSLYFALFCLPGFSAIRVVTRIALVMLFPVAIVTGCVLDRAWDERSRRPLIGAAALIGCVILVFEATLITRATSTVKEWRMRLEALAAETVHPLNEEHILAVRSGSGPAGLARQIDAMLLAQAFNARTTNGYSGNFPTGWMPMKTCRDIARVIQRGEAFRRWHGEPCFKAERTRILPIGFGDCRNTLAEGETLRDLP
jgi:hypothetical protein